MTLIPVPIVHSSGVTAAGRAKHAQHGSGIHLLADGGTVLSLQQKNRPYRNSEFYSFETSCLGITDSGYRLARYSCGVIPKVVWNSLSLRESEMYMRNPPKSCCLGRICLHICNLVLTTYGLLFIFRPTCVLEAYSLHVIARSIGVRVGELYVVGERS